MLMMSGLDCHAAPLDQRQRLAFSSEGAMETLRWLHTQSGIAGCVLLSTCNRTELYLNGDGETPWRLLCRGAGVPEADMEPYFTTRCGVDAARHLMEVTCGLHSQILGRIRSSLRCERLWSWHWRPKPPTLRWQPCFGTR